MDTFELVITLLSFIYALALAHLLQGATDLLFARKRVRFSLAHALWALLALLAMFGNWLSLFSLRDVDWTVQLIILEFLLAIIVYFACSLLIPPKAEEGPIDLVAFVRIDGWLFKAPYVPLVGLVLAVQFSFAQYRAEAENVGALIEALVMLGLVAVSIWRRERWVQIVTPAILIAAALPELAVG